MIANIWISNINLQSNIFFNSPWYVNVSVIIGIVITGTVIAVIVDIIKKNKFKKELKKHKIEEQKKILDSKINSNNNSNNEHIKIEEYNKKLAKDHKPLFGIFNNFIGAKTAIRLRPLVLVKEQKDSCPLCRPFENKVLSLERKDSKYTTMDFAIKNGYHHIGCSHVDIDFYPGNSIIPKQQFSNLVKDKNYKIKKEQMLFEHKIRILKLLINNENINNDFNLENLDKIESEYIGFLTNNNLKRNITNESVNNK